MKEISLSQISEVVGISEEEIKGKSRKENIVIARELHWLYLYTKGYSSVEISQQYDRQWQTIRSGIRTIENLISTKHPLVEPYAKLIESFYSDQLADTTK